MRRWERFSNEDPRTGIDAVPPGACLSDLPELFDKMSDRQFEAAYINAIVSVIAETRVERDFPSDEQFSIVLGYCKRRYRRIVHKLAAENQLYTFGPRPRGEQTRSSKLKEFAVRVILRLPHSLTSEEIGPLFGVSPEQVGRIRRRERWPHLPSVEPLPPVRKIPTTKTGGLPLSQKQARLAKMWGNTSQQEPRRC